MAGKPVFVIATQVIFVAEILGLVKFKVSEIVTGAGAVHQHNCFAQKRKVKNKIGIKLRYVITGIVGSRKMTNRRLPENTFTGQ